MGRKREINKNINYLMKGMEPEKRLKGLLGFTSIRSEPILAALYDYYVKGHSQKFCVEYYEIARDKFVRADNILNRVAGEYEQLKADDFHSRNKKPRKKRVDPLSDTDMVLPE